MRLDTSQQMRLQQKQILAPRMIQSMEILQLPVMELQERIQQELQENPVLELKEAPPEDAPAATEEEWTAEDVPGEGEKELVVEDNGSNELDFERLEALGKDWEDALNEEHRPSRNGLDAEADRKHDAMQNMPSRPQSLQDHLFDQVGFLEVPEKLIDLVRFLITHLDERGRLTLAREATPLGSKLDPDQLLMTIVAGYDRPVSPEEAEEALDCLQKLDPPGIGARTLGECLLLQITPETPHRDVVRLLVENHIDDIQHNRLPVIERRTGYDLETIQEAIEVLRHLNPNPGAAFASDHIPYIVPDIAVERTEEGEYQVRLLDDYIPKVYINRSYIDRLKDKGTDPQTREYLKRKMQSANWLMESIEQRRSTLEKVTKAIIAHQKGFLDKGPEYITPLKMQQIADQVGVHVTTVSRAVDDKYVQTPRGVFPLKRFFGGGTTTAEGEEVAWEIIKQKLLELIGQEDKANPLSDDELVKRLNDAGYPVARRTVTKYRKLLKIPSSRQRKDWTLRGSSTPHPAPAAEPAAVAVPSPGPGAGADEDE